MRIFTRFLLAGTSHLAILMMGAGGAWAGAGDSEFDFNTSQTDGGGVNHPGISYNSSAGILTVSGAITSNTTGNEAMNIYGDGSGVPHLQVNVTGNLTGATGVRQDNGHAGGGIIIDDDSSMADKSITITNSGTISGASGTDSYAGGFGIDVYVNADITINNSGTINGGSEDASSSLSRHALGFDQAQTAVTFNNYSTGIINGDIWASSHGDQINFYGGALNGSILGKATSGGTMDGAGADVYFHSGTTTVNGDIGKAFQTISGYGQTAHVGPVQALTLTNGATLKFSRDSDIHAVVFDYVNGGSVDLGTSRVRFYDYEFADANETTSGAFYFKTTIDANAEKHGYWVFTQVGGERDYYGFNHGSTTIIVPSVLGTVQTGAKYIIIQDTDGRTLVNTPSVVNGAGYRWTVSNVRCNGGTYSISDGVSCAGQTDSDGISYGNGYTNIIITADRQNAAGSASGTNGAGVRALATYSGSDPGLQALSQAVNNLTSDADIKKAGAQLRPETTGNTAQASMGAVTQALSTIQVRTDAVRVASSGTGISSGETLKGLGVWGQGFGSTARQGERNSIAGYDADTYGLAFGADFKVIDPVRVGLSFAYANTGVDSTGDRTGSGQDIDSYIASLYGTYSGNGWYADGALTYGLHKYDATRHVAITGAPSQTLKASYDGQQIGARAEAGVPLALGQAVVTPLASLAYNTLKQDSYGESGGSAALQVGSSSTDSIRSGLGAKVSARVATIGNWEISPNARAVWHHEFNTSSQDQTSAYVAGGSSFTTPGSNIATEHFNIGVGLDVASVRNTTVSAKYDADLADKYVSHSASLQLRTEF